MIEDILALTLSPEVVGWIAVALISLLVTALGGFIRHRVNKQDATIKNLYGKCDAITKELSDFKLKVHETFVSTKTHNDNFNALREDFKRVESNVASMQELLTKTLLKLGGK